MIRNACITDAKALSEIYNYYIQNTVVTFEEELISAEEMERRIAAVQNHYPWLVFEDDGVVAGYSYASHWKPRSAYRYSAESTVYLDPAHVNKGIGKKLYAELIRQLREMEMHSIIGGIALPNAASIRLHEGLGFAKIGQFTEQGLKFGRWIDVGYWQLLLKDKF
ncbi:MAG TPA: arsinothricin resistance N-acetyltransferase ArsN1 family B [Flavipsychrobacter sp.]|nr:arsinothricin resistance N-acetyltransferase ArsN1 family B [Flavipsychrobacter sp.]